MRQSNKDIRAYSLVAAFSIAKKNLIISSRYKLEIIFWGVVPVLWVLPFILSGIAISGGYSNQNLANTVGTGDFIEYIIIGSIIFSYMGSAIWAMGNALRWEQYTGTLEVLYLAPVSRLTILMGASLSQSIIATIQAVLQYLIFSLIFGIVYPIPKLLVVGFLLLIMIIDLYGFAFLLAAVIIFFKDPDVLNDFINTFFYLVTPVNYPLDAIPYPLRIFGFLIPVTYTIIGARSILLSINTTLTLESILIVLIALGVALWVVGYSTFKTAEYWTKKRGKLSAY
ncbi:MAG: ABC transporter permease [Candidatus Asgardarchaeia archaeon]